MKMQIKCPYDKLMSISDIKLNPKNPNKHSPSQVERLAKVLGYQGIRKPLIVSKRSGLLVTGHGTIEAALKNGWDKVPVSVQSFKDEAQEYAHMVADNALQAWSDLDLASINMEFPEFGPDLDIDMMGMRGFVLNAVDKVGAKELKEVEFSKFQHMCPKCGFEFDDKK